MPARTNRTAMNRARVRDFIVCVCIALHAGAVHAQAAISGPVRVVVVGAPGGPSDTTLRLIVPKLSAALGQPFVVENRPGTLGQVAAAQMKTAQPDGRTLMLGNSGTHTVAPTLYRNILYDPIADFAPVSLINSTGYVLVSHPSFPARSIGEFFALAKRQPGRIDIAIAGPTGEMASESLMAVTGTRLNGIRYKGSSPAEIAVLSGEVTVSLLTPVATLSHVSAGKLRALAVTTTTRLALLPTVPTLIESGVSGYSFHFWNGLFAPANTPEPVIRRLHAEVVRAVESKEVQERYAALGFVTKAGTPKELADLIKDELARFRKLVADTGIGGR